MTMTMTASIESETRVDCVHLADGKIVRLAGALDGDDVASVRKALLTPLPHGCTDVVVDAGLVTAISDDVVAVLIAAPVWAETEGGRFFLSQSSSALDETLEELDLVDLLPRLSAGPAAGRGRVPGSRRSSH
jgi:anti-anti-sigma regulatory factor